MEGIPKQALGILIAVLSGVLHTSVGFLLQLADLNFADVIFVQGLTNTPFILALGLCRGISFMPVSRLDNHQKEEEEDVVVHRCQGPHMKSTTFIFLILQGRIVFLRYI